MLSGISDPRVRMQEQRQSAKQRRPSKWERFKSEIICCGRRKPKILLQEEDDVGGEDDAMDHAINEAAKKMEEKQKANPQINLATGERSCKKPDGFVD